MEVKQLILDQTAKYPLMRPQDYVKLVFQRFCGPGHMVLNPETALMRLNAERSEDKTGVRYEDIGNGLARCYLDGDEDTLTNAQIARAFYETALSFKRDRLGLEDALNLLKEMADENLLTVSSEEMGAYIDAYRAAGYPVVSHSAEYKQAYAPSYRVIFHSF